MLILSSVAVAENPAQNEVIGNVKRVTLPSWDDSAPCLTLVLPNGFELESTKGPDFDVHQMRHPHDIGVLTIYIGHHPDRNADQNATLIKKRFGSRQVEFKRKKTAYGSFTDALIPDFFKGEADDSVQKLMLHVFMHVKEERFYDEAWSILESVSKSKPSGE